MKHAHVDDTLTREERAAPFRIAPADADPLPTVTRLQVEIDGTDVIAERSLREVLECIIAGTIS